MVSVCVRQKEDGAGSTGIPHAVINKACTSYIPLSRMCQQGSSARGVRLARA